MIKKYYTLLIASEVDHINRSIRLSRLSMGLILLSIIFIIYFAYIGLSSKIYSKNESVPLKDFKSNIADVLLSLDSSEKSDSIKLRQIQTMINKNGPEVLMIAPTIGFVTQGIDTLNNHHGIDIISHKGDNIRSALDGIVVFTGENGDLGNTLIISHPYNYFTVYGHCDSIFVKLREKVSKGHIIGTLGESGITTAPHLHFEIWHGNNIIDPRDMIEKYGELDVSTE